MFGLLAPSLAADPVHGTSLEIHHRENPNAIRLDLVQKCVRKSPEKATTDRPTENRSRFGMSLDGLEAPVDLPEEGDAQSGLFKVVVLRRLVQLVFGESVKLGSTHSSQLGPSISKNVAGWPARAWLRVPGGVTAIGFLCPEALILLV